jgi:hypothetical protein
MKRKLIWITTCVLVLALFAFAQGRISSLGFTITQSVDLATDRVIGNTNTLASSATTADQVVTSFTVSAGKTFYLSKWDVNARLTTYAATATFFGDCSLEAPSGTKLETQIVTGTGQGIPVPETAITPHPIATGGQVVRVVCTPSAATAFTWRGNIIGFER